MTITSTRIVGLAGLVLLILAGFWLADNNSSSDFNGLSVLSNGESGEADIDGDGVVIQRESISRTGSSRVGNRDPSASSTLENTDQSDAEPASGLSQTSPDSAAEDSEEPSLPATEVLSAEVFNVISEVQTRFRENQFEEGLNELNALYLEINSNRDANALLGLANAHYALQQYDQAIPFLVEHIQSLMSAGTEVAPAKLGLLTTMGALTENAEVLALMQEFLNTR